MATKNLVPRTAGEGKLGISTKKWEEINALTGSFSNISASGFISASYFKGDGSGLSGVTAEWDGTHTGTAEFIGNITASGYTISASSFVGDGTNITGVTAEWDGTHVGDGIFSGNISSSGDLHIEGNITGSGNLEIAGNISGSSISNLTFGGKLVASGDISGSGNLEIAGNISGSSISTGSFGYLHLGYPLPTSDTNLATGSVWVSGSGGGAASGSGYLMIAGIHG